jgi:hypothetical protein
LQIQGISSVAAATLPVLANGLDRLAQEQHIGAVISQSTQNGNLQSHHTLPDFMTPNRAFADYPGW